MFKKKKWDFRHIIIVILIVIALFLGITALVNKEDRKLTYFEKVIKDTGLGIVKILKMPFDASTPRNDDPSKNVLKAKYKESKKEVKELKELLKLNSTLSENSYLNATVIDRNLGYWNNSFTIDKGSKNDVSINDAVITNEGLIGKIINTSNFSSTVKLLTSDDTNNKISVKIEINGNYVYGLLSGYDKKKKIFIIEGISDNIEIKKGSLVTTTGLGTAFPSGILIGKVTSVSTDNFDLSKTVKIKSDVNFENVNYVTVLKRDAK